MSVVRLVGKVNAAGQLVVDLPWVPKEPEVEVMVEDPVDLKKRSFGLSKSHSALARTW